MTDIVQCNPEMIRNTQLPAGEAPSVRDVIRLVTIFSKAVCLSEELARNGGGGVVRIRELEPVMAAMRSYLERLPVGVIDGDSPKPEKPNDERGLNGSTQPSIVLELREDGLVLISGWVGGKRDSAYRPMPLNEVLGELSALARELQQQPHLSSSDAHAH